LLRLRPRQQHAKRQHVLEASVVNPSAFIHEHAMHERDLAGWAAEAQAADLE
jgi:hypothetical protein